MYGCTYVCPFLTDDFYESMDEVMGFKGVCGFIVVLVRTVSKHLVERVAVISHSTVQQRNPSMYGMPRKSTSLKVIGLLTGVKDLEGFFGSLDSGKSHGTKGRT